MNNVDLFLMSKAKYFDADALPYIREQLMNADESKWPQIHMTEFKDPTMMLIVSLLVGHFGIDRFLMGDTGLGIAKLLTCGGFGIWTVVDWFLVMGNAKKKNYEKLQYIFLSTY